MEMARTTVSRIRQGQNRFKVCTGILSMFAAQPSLPLAC
jgi:hypothetical protein